MQSRRLRHYDEPPDETCLNRWVAEALVNHHRVIEKIRGDIPG
jgi:hypothetical protein